MTRWFRFYDESLNDPKVQRLAGETYKAWVNLLCLASKDENGVLPCLSDIAFALRLSDEQTSDLLNQLYKLQLLDEVEVPNGPMSYTPHNWKARQYKSDKTDPTAPERQKAYRKRNADRNAAVTVTATRTDTEADTETEQKEDAANAGAVAPVDPSIAERDFFSRGKQVLGKNAGGQLAKLKAAKGHNIALARAAVETAATKEKPAEYIAAVIRGPPVIKPNTAHQQERQTGREILDDIGQFISGSSGQANPGVLRHDPGDGPEGVRGGTGGNLIDISPTRDRARG